MRSIAAILMAGVLAVPILSTRADSDTISRHVLVPLDRTAHLCMVSEDGDVRALGYSFPRLGHGTAGQGSNRPRLSPDERWVAFIRERDLWLFDVESLTETRITEVMGEECDSVGCHVSISQWAPDSRSLLYCIAPSFSERCRFSTVCPGAGFHFLDVETGMSTPAEIRGQFQCWLPSGEFVVTGNMEYRFDGLTLDNGDLGLYDPVRKARTAVVAERPAGDPIVCFSQIACDPRGTRIAFTYAMAPGKLQIVHLELATRKITPVTELGPGTRFQWPFYSPSGRRLAYLKTEKPTQVHVDGRPIFSGPGISTTDRCMWITDEVMAVAAGDTLSIVEVETGAVRGNPVSIAELTTER